MTVSSWSSKLLWVVLLFVSAAAFYALGWSGLLVPASTLLLFLVTGFFLRFERVLMHSAYYFSLFLLFSIFIFGILLIFPSKIFIICMVLIGLLAASAIAVLWRHWRNFRQMQFGRWTS